MRDAELWDDVARWVWDKYGAGAGLCLAAAELLGGNADGVAERIMQSKKAEKAIRRMSAVPAGASAASTLQSNRDRRKTAREITETAVRSVCVAYGAWCMVCGAWCMVHGVWCMVYGAWCMVHGVWCMVYAITETAERSKFR
jgi:hypothetical protein